MKLEKKILECDIVWGQILSEGRNSRLIFGMIAEVQMGNGEKVMNYVNAIIEDAFDDRNGKKRKVDNCLTIAGSWLDYYLRYFAEVCG